MTAFAALAALADGVWVSGLLAAGACAAVAATRHRSPTAAYRVRLLGLGLCVALPIAALWRQWDAAAAPAPGSLPAEADRQPVPANLVANPGPVRQPGTTRRPDTREPAARPHGVSGETAAVIAAPVPVIRRSLLVLRDGPWAASVLAVLLLGLGVGFGRLLLVIRASGRLKRRSCPVAAVPPEWAEALQLSGLRRRVALLEVPQLRTPAVVGFVRPAVLLPVGLLDRLSASERRQVLLHEAMHLRRRDDWVALAQQAALVCCWFHPVAYWLSAGADVERELVCDATVARFGGRRRYARTLLQVTRLAGPLPTPPGAPAFMTSRSRLGRRIEALLHTGGTDLWRRGLAAPFAPAALAGAVLVAPLGTAPAVVLPPPAPAPLLVGATGAVRGPVGLAIDKALTRMADSGFSGTVLVERGGVVVLEKGYGLSNRAAAVQATADTRYALAGFTKAVTAAAVIRLVNEGRIGLADPVGRYLPELRRKGNVTIEQLLTHADGLTLQGAPVYRADPSAFLRAVDEAPSAFPPGTGYRYNDFGHSVLALVIERVTGRPYEEHVRSGVLHGGSGLGFEPDGDVLATEYRGASGVPIGERRYHWGRRGSLGLVGTARDAFDLLTGLDRLPPGDRAALLAARGPTPHGTTQTFGWERITTPGGHRVLRRVAGTPGFEGEILRDETGGWSAVILVNSRVGWRFRVWRAIEALAVD